MAHYQTMTSDKDRDTALILCICGGMFGLHQFYVGNIKKGLVYFFTVGLFCFGWLGDILKIYLGTFKDNVGAPLRATKEQNNASTTNQENIIHITKNEEDYITQLEKLSDLKEKGIITQEEFEKKKQELLK